MIDRMNNTNEKHSEHKIIGNDLSNSLIPHSSLLIITKNRYRYKNLSPVWTHLQYIRFLNNETELFLFNSTTTVHRKCFCIHIVLQTQLYPPHLDLER